MNLSFEDVSKTLADTVATASQGVLSVAARKRMPTSGIAWSEDGLILTAAHGIRRREGIRVRLPDADWSPAELVGVDPSTDLALLRAEASGLKPLAWQDDAELAVGQLALALGRPGHSMQASLGLISALGAAWKNHAGGQIDRFIRADLVMYPGFSGGPLIGGGGQVLGMTTSGMARGANLALPLATVKRVTDELLEHGRVRRGFLGVGVQATKLPDRLVEEAGQARGLVVVGLESDGPAEAGGLRLGDTLLSLDDQALLDVDDLTLALAGRAGATVHLRLARGEALTEQELTLGVV